MAEDTGRDFEDQARSHHQEAEQAPAAPEFDSASPQASDSAYPASLVGDAKLSGRGNAPVRAAIVQRLQQTYGNRATQRFIQRSAGATQEGSQEDIGQRIQSKSGGGSSLDSSVQRSLESGLGADMSGVRVHTDSEADSMARSVDAVAFTTGSDIFFREGAYNPGSTDGMRLLAHEATHTVQQSQGPVSGTPTAGGVSVSDPSDSYEQAAEQAANNVVSNQGNNASAQRMVDPSGSGTAVQREAAPDDDEEELPAQRMVDPTGSGMAVQREAAPDDDEELSAQT